MSVVAAVLSVSRRREASSALTSNAAVAVGSRRAPIRHARISPRIVIDDRRQIRFGSIEEAEDRRVDVPSLVRLRSAKVFLRTVGMESRKTEGAHWPAVAAEPSEVSPNPKSKFNCPMQTHSTSLFGSTCGPSCRDRHSLVVCIEGAVRSGDRAPVGQLERLNRDASRSEQKTVARSMRAQFGEREGVVRTGNGITFV